MSLQIQDRLNSIEAIEMHDGLSEIRMDSGTVD